MISEVYTCANWNLCEDINFTLHSHNLTFTTLGKLDFRVQQVYNLKSLSMIRFCTLYSHSLFCTTLYNLISGFYTCTTWNLYLYGKMTYFKLHSHTLIFITFAKTCFSLLLCLHVLLHIHISYLYLCLNQVVAAIRLSLCRAVTAFITNFSFHIANFPFYETITNILCYKTNSPFYKIKLRVMILTFHILILSGYHNIKIYILILIFHSIKLNCYYKTKLLIIILNSVL